MTPLPPGEIHVWTLDLDAAGDREVLSTEERAAAARFVRPEDRRRYAAAHAGLRGVLAEYLGRPARALGFVPAARGKLALADPGEAWLRFNLSHSHEAALVACARDREVGVDIEWMRDGIEPAEIVERFFSAEERREWAGLAPAARRDAFFHGWTRKEAYVKGLGEGLAYPSDAYTVRLSPAGPAALLADRLSPEAPAAWSLSTVGAPPGYAAAVAAAGPAGRIVERRWGQFRLDPTAPRG